MTTKYLGQEIVSDHPFTKDTPEEWALRYIWQYGQIDGAHHKQWVLDQVARILNGAPITVMKATWDDGQYEYRYEVESSEKYELWVQNYKGEFVDGEYEYDYDEGIAP